MTDCILVVPKRPSYQLASGHTTLPAAVSGEIWAHRAAWSEVNGPIPKGMNVLHRCDVGACINVEHLFLGTQGDNMRDMAAKGRHNSHLYPALRAGERNGQSKLETADVYSIRSSTDSHAALGRRFGVDESLIRRIRNREAWRHVS